MNPQNDGLHAIKPVEVVDGELNFVCLAQDCPEPCCGPFGGVHSGIAALDGRPLDEIVLTEDDSRRLIAAGHSHLIDMRPGQHDSMKLQEDGSCSAFKNGRCSIHESKPTVCRAFPFYVDMFVGLCCVTGCSGFGAGFTPLSQLVPEIKAAGKMYRFWLETIEDQATAVTSASDEK